MTHQKNKYFHISIFFYLTATLLVFNTLGCSLSSTDTAQPTGLAVKFDCIPLPQEPQNAKVVSVIDGDTIKIEIDRQKVNVRYIGINSPELDSNERELAEEALQFNAGLVENQIVTLYRDTSDTDRFGRLLRYVFMDDVFVNYELIRMGYARQRDYPPDSACKDLFIKAQQEAIAMRRGIWKTQ